MLTITICKENSSTYSVICSSNPKPKSKSSLSFPATKTELIMLIVKTERIKNYNKVTQKYNFLFSTNIGQYKKMAHPTHFKIMFSRYNMVYRICVPLFKT